MKLNIRVRIVFCPCGQEHGVNIALYKCIPRQHFPLQSVSDALFCRDILLVSWNREPHCWLSKVSLHKQVSRLTVMQTFTRVIRIFCPLRGRARRTLLHQPPVRTHFHRPFILPQLEAFLLATASDYLWLRTVTVQNVIFHESLCPLVDVRGNQVFLSTLYIFSLL